MKREERILLSKLKVTSRLLGYGTPRPVVEQHERIKRELEKIEKENQMKKPTRLHHFFYSKYNVEGANLKETSGPMARGEREFNAPKPHPEAKLIAKTTAAPVGPCSGWCWVGLWEMPS